MRVDDVVTDLEVADGCCFELEVGYGSLVDCLLS
jgi:hypothetical protein